MGYEREHAVVLGAGMGGLLAARVLADFYAQVTVIERDELPAGPMPRKGVPHGRHFHGLLLRGVTSLEAMFPGLVDALIAGGAVRARFLREVRFVLSGHELARADAGAEVVQATRPMLEGAVRARVAGLPNVKIVDGCDAVGPVSHEGRVTGIRIARRRAAGAAETLAADLVVDAMGRAGRTRVWLPALGYPPPQEERIRVGITYVSRFVRIPSGALGGDRAVVVGPVPGRPLAMGLGLQEGDRWLATVAGMAGRRPPDGEQGFLAFVRQVAPPDVYAAIHDAQPLSDVVTHAFPASVRHRYERLRRLPDGLIPFADAICSFNPIYGQGMTVAAVEADALRACLAAGGGDLPGRFVRAAATAIDPAWRLAAGADLALPEIEGPRRASTRVINRYIARLHRAASRDPALAATFMRVAGLLDPPSALVAPDVLRRVLVGRGGRGRN